MRSVTETFLLLYLLGRLCFHPKSGADPVEADNVPLQYQMLSFLTDHGIHRPSDSTEASSIDIDKFCAAECELRRWDVQVEALGSGKCYPSCIFLIWFLVCVS